MKKSEVLKKINESVYNTNRALENIYREKTFAVVKYGRIDCFFKTKRGAEGYKKRESLVSYYDEMTFEMVNCGDGIEIVEILESEIKELKTNVYLWFKEVENCIGSYSYLTDCLIKNANRYLDKDTELYKWVVDSANEIKANKDIKLPKFINDVRKSEEGIAEESKREENSNQKDFQEVEPFNSPIGEKTIIQTFKVEESKIKDIMRIIKKINKDKNKIEMEIKPLDDIVLDGKYSKVNIKINEVILKYKVIENKSYKILGEIEITDTDENIVYFLGDNEENLNQKDFQKKTITCEKCSKKRRKILYIVKDIKRNKIITVGRNCLSDLFNICDIENYLKRLEAGLKAIQIIEEEKFDDKADNIGYIVNNFESKEVFFNTFEILQIIKNLIDTNGYISYNKAIEMGIKSTKDLLNEKFFKFDMTIEQGLVKEVSEEIKKDIDFFLKNYEENNDYHLVLKGLLINKFINKNKIGLLVGFFKAIEYLNKKLEIALKNAKSDYIGAIGDKIEMKLILNDFKMFPNNYYGYTYYYFFKDEKENTLVWKTSKDIGESFDIDLLDLISKKIILKGAIKEHFIYNNEKQTILTRCKIKFIEGV